MTKLVLIDRLIDTLEQNILPLTEQGVARGNKIFGAAILHKSDLSLVLAETNNERENPLWHGEMHAIKRFYEMPEATLPTPKDCLFLSSHEPCSLCLSAITWSGFDNFWFLFSHVDSRDAFDIPHDLKILKEVFRLESGGYAKHNAFWQAHDLRHEVRALADNESSPRLQRIKAVIKRYEDLSTQYQAQKDKLNVAFN